MANDFKPTIGSRVSKDEAEKWIKKYDDEHRKEKKKDTKSVFYGKDVLQAIIDTPHAAGVSIFLSMKYSPHAGKDTVNFVLVPTKEDGKLIWYEETSGKDGGTTRSWDEGAVCPPTCPEGE
jgi:hypothetical protein